MLSVCRAVLQKGPGNAEERLKRRSDVHLTTRCHCGPVTVAISQVGEVRQKTSCVTIVLCHWHVLAISLATSSPPAVECFVLSIHPVLLVPGFSMVFFSNSQLSSLHSRPSS